MKIESSKNTIVAILVVVAAAVAFWMLLLSPKREEANELSTQAENLQTTLSTSQAKVAEGQAAKREFPENYQQLVTLGKAVPPNDETASLLVMTNSISDDVDVDFQAIELGTTDGSAATGAEGTTEEGGAPVAGVPPTEAEAALLPLGATVGAGGLAIMPYDLIFGGRFFGVADFIRDIDSLVDAKDEKVKVNGRLVTIDGFSLAPAKPGSSRLDVNFSVTTYVVAPGQSLTAGASPTGPAEAVPAPETTEGIPSSSTEAK